MMIDGVAHPSVVYTYAWDVVLYNREFWDFFGGVRRHESAHPARNPARYVMLHPDAPLILGGGDPEAYREMWLMPALAHFAATCNSGLQTSGSWPSSGTSTTDLLSSARMARRRAGSWSTATSPSTPIRAPSVTRVPGK